MVTGIKIINKMIMLLFHILLFLPIKTIDSFSINRHTLSTFVVKSVKVSKSITSMNLAQTSIPYPTEKELDSFLDVAIIASKKAGDIILGYDGGAEVTKVKANSRDLLTLVDPLCEKTIRDTVLDSFPDHKFLGEEDVPPGAEASAAALTSILSNDASPYLWIVDPIDGTSNFVHGMPLCMPSVALAYQGEIVVGVIHDPHRNETFYAKKGYGAFLDNNDTPINVSKEDTIGDAIIAMGSPPGIKSMEASLQGIQTLMPKCRTIRMLGSAALMLAWVACGRLSCYWEYDLSSWDVAAGSLLIREAGGKFTNLSNDEWTLIERKICASNGLVHEKILDSLNEVGVH